MTTEAISRSFRHAAGLSDHELQAHLVMLVRQDRQLTAELLVHLGEVDIRRLYAVRGYSSLFGYAVQALGFSEDEAYRRITAARAVRKFRAALECVLDGKLHLSGLLLLAPHLTPDNHVELLRAGCGKTKRQVEQLVAERFPRPDVPASVHRLPRAKSEMVRARAIAELPKVALDEPTDPAVQQPMQSTAMDEAAQAFDSGTLPVSVRPDPPTTGLNAQSRSLSPRPADRARVEPLAPERFRITFTASAEFVQKLERAQELASHAVAPKDIAALLERALDALVTREQKRRFAVNVDRTLGSAGNAGANGSKPNSELAPERVAKVPKSSSELAPAPTEGTASRPGQPNPRNRSHSVRRASRTVPAEVRRTVSERDGGRCSFVDPKTGRRCDERRFLTFEHNEPFALGGTATVDNVRLLCACHNALLARRAFGEQHVAATVAAQGSKRSAESDESTAREVRPIARLDTPE
jgi:hypothetical protein